jgi:hypothetical protein
VFGDFKKSVIASAMFAFHQQSSHELEDDVQDQGQAEQNVDHAGCDEWAKSASPSGGACHGTSGVECFCVQGEGDNGESGAQEVHERAHVGEHTASEWNQIQQNHDAHCTRNTNSETGVLHWPTRFEVGVRAGFEGFVSKTDVAALVEDDGEDEHAREENKVDEDENKDAFAGGARYTTARGLIAKFVVLGGFRK